MGVINRIDTQEHEDNGFGTAAQHLHGVLDGCMRFGRDIAFDVIFHRDAAKCDPTRAAAAKIIRNAVRM